MPPRPCDQFRRVFKRSAVESVCDKEFLSASSIGIDKVDAEGFRLRRDSECRLISEKVLSGKYKFSKFKERLISKGAGKIPRQLSIPTIRDRLTLKILCNYLFSVFPAAKPDLPHVKITALRNAIDSGNYSHFIKIDLKDFYPSIDHELLIKKLRRKIRIAIFKNLLEAAITNPTVAESNTALAYKPTQGVAQGLSISNVLAEIFMLDVDHRLLGIAPFCVRYVDDILLLCDSEPYVVLRKALKALNRNRLNPHFPNEIAPDQSKSKFGKISDGFDYLGYRIKPNAVSVRDKSIASFESSIVSTFVDYKYRLKKCKNEKQKIASLERFRWALNLKLTGCIYKNQRFGWIFYYSQINDLRVLRRIDKTVSKLFRRFKIEANPAPKKILKAFHESKRRDKLSHRYIVNYDAMTSDKIVAFLNELGIDTQLSDQALELRFHNLIRKATRKLEKDVSTVS